MKQCKFKVWNLDENKYELGSFYISDEGDLYTQTIDLVSLVIEKVKFKYKIEWEKECTKCEQYKDKGEFYKYKNGNIRMPCKACMRKYSQSEERKSYRKSFYKKTIEKRKAYEQTPKRKKAHCKRSKEYIKNNPKKRKALYDLHLAIRYGRIIKPTVCSICGKGNCRIEGHHTDYSKPFDVIWCCHNCHKDIHQELLTKKKTT
jgi:hypothetical protein